MSCLDANALGRLQDGDLDGPARAAVFAHLEGCPACSEVVTEIGRLAPPVRDLPSRYRLDGRLGAGAMGEVWRAEDLQLGRAVALKFVRPDEADDPERQQRLLREARALAQVRHPHVVPVYDVWQQAGGDGGVAMALIEGVDAAGWRAAEPRAAAQVLALWRQIADALVAVHRTGLVHRDLKPANVLVEADTHAWLGDFGLARRDLADDVMATITATGAVIGTPAYMAPEQLLGARATEASDQFAWCVCVWEALTGDRPFNGSTPAALAVAMHAGLPSAAAIAPTVRAVLARGLAVEPAARWPTMGALIDAMDAATEPKKPGRRPSSRHRLVLAGMIGVVAVGLTAVGLRATDRAAESREPSAADAPVALAGPVVMQSSGAARPAVEEPSTPPTPPPPSPPPSAQLRARDPGSQRSPTSGAGSALVPISVDADGAPIYDTNAPGLFAYTAAWKRGRDVATDQLAKRQPAACLATLAALPANPPGNWGLRQELASLRALCGLMAVGCAEAPAQLDRWLVDGTVKPKALDYYRGWIQHSLCK